MRLNAKELSRFITLEGVEKVVPVLQECFRLHEEGSLVGSVRMTSVCVSYS